MLVSNKLLQCAAILFATLLLTSCSSLHNAAKPGALKAAKPSQWAKVGIFVEAGSNFFTDPLKLANTSGATSVQIGTTSFLLPDSIPKEPKPFASNPMDYNFPKIFKEEFESTTGIESKLLVYGRDTPGLKGDAFYKRLRDTFEVDAIIIVYFLWEGTVFPKGSYPWWDARAQGSVIVETKIFDTNTQVRIWDNFLRDETT